MLIIILLGLNMDLSPGAAPYQKKEFKTLSSFPDDGSPAAALAFSLIYRYLKMRS
jgi:hypothetical protein